MLPKKKRLRFVPAPPNWSLRLGRMVANLNQLLGLYGVPERIGRGGDLRQITALEARYGFELIGVFRG